MSFPIQDIAADAIPPLLRELPDAPERLFMRGALPSHDDYRYLCVVGSRAASEYGRRACASLIAGLSGKPIVIVSGLALGIDAEAHKAALAASLPTVAVLPSGLTDESIYPSLNHALAMQILAKGGALMSEYKTGKPAGQWVFPARNRIMSGLSHATLIIEASEKSGTLITMRLSLDYNRDVMAVPHPILSERGAGNNRLIREGATLVRDSADILEILGFKPEEPATAELPLDINESERTILLTLIEPMTRDELIERAELSAQLANIALTSLSIRGFIIERLGKIERI